MSAKPISPLRQRLIDDMSARQTLQPSLAAPNARAVSFSFGFKPFPKNARRSGIAPEAEVPSGEPIGSSRRNADIAQKGANWPPWNRTLAGAVLSTGLGKAANCDSSTSVTREIAMV
jgi:hypothetical protein